MLIQILATDNMFEKTNHLGMTYSFSVAIDFGNVLFTLISWQ